MAFVILINNFLQYCDIIIYRQLKCDYIRIN